MTASLVDQHGAAGPWSRCKYGETLSGGSHAPAKRMSGATNWLWREGLAEGTTLRTLITSTVIATACSSIMINIITSYLLMIFLHPIV
ncbi:MAG: hypothetical protein HY700_02005 [Gemmatimonadetes bacterium]|nr:hypothetical protein [Gemmatimonadota bacterium]